MSSTDKEGAPSTSDNKSLQEFFIDVYKTDTKPAWDIGAPQQTIIDLESQGVLQGKILDVGCGLGENAIYLGQKGYKVTATDYAQDALAKAKERLAKAGGPAVENVKFLQANCFDMGATVGDEKFDTMLDAAVLHGFNDDEAQKYIASATPLVKLGGKAVILVFSDKNPDPWKSGARRLTEAYLRETFSEAAGWRVESIQDSKYQATMMATGFALAYLLIATRI